MIGQTIAHYEITARLGRGGMGEVFRARDTKLDREVAIKLLPPEFSDDPERLARFEREARTLASLQHPNVASIYGFEHVGEHRFLVMELAEGQDLAARLENGPLESTEALGIALQIARGLSAAHERGIIHRDLKPANVMLGSDGKVKLLDFGLARPRDPSVDDADLAHSPTITAAMTQAGVILGTAAYMSPEQARGRPVDRRSDVWAMGAVLFEMLSGQKPFDGEVVSDVIARILERDPPWDDLPENTNPFLRRLLKRCLAKNPEDRFHDVADARLEIEEILADPDGASLGFGATAGANQPKVAGGPLRWWQLLPWVLLGLTITVWVVQTLQPAPAPARAVEFAIPAPGGFGLREFEVAPDGNAAVFVALDRGGTSSLWLRRFANADPERLAGTEGASFPFWSPDSRSIAFFLPGKLMRMDLATRSLQTLADAPNGRGGAWGPDGTILFAPRGRGPLQRLSARGGSVEPATEIVGEAISHRFPHFLADGEHFVFAAQGRNSMTRERYVADLGGGGLVRLPDGLSEVYPVSDKLLYVREGTLVAHSFDVQSGQLIGDPQPLLGNISDTYPRTGNSAVSVSGQGVLAYSQRTLVPSQFRWYGRDGRTLKTVAPPDFYSVPAFSHDGRYVAFVRGGEEPGDSIWTLDLQRGSMSLLGEFGQGQAIVGDWSPDDQSVFHLDGGIIYRLDLRSGESSLVLDTTQLFEGKSLQAPRSLNVSHDGQWMVFDGWDPATDYDLWLLELREGGQPVELAQTDGTQGRPRFSPDRRWIAYESNETGRWEIYLRSVEPGSQRWLVSTSGGNSPRWSPDGTELYYQSARDALHAVPIDLQGDVPEVGLPESLFTPPSGPEQLYDVANIAPELVATDGDRFLFHVLAGEAPVDAIRIVLDWRQLLTR